MLMSAYLNADEATMKQIKEDFPEFTGELQL